MAKCSSTFCSRVFREGRDRSWLWALLAILLAAPAAEPADTTLDWTVVREGMSALNGVAGNDSVYVVVGDYGEVYTSDDAVNWRRQAPDSGRRNLRGVTHNDGTHFVAVGDPWGREGETTAVAMISTDNGSSWRPWETGTAGQYVGLAAVAFGSGRYVAVGDSGEVLWAAEGGSWSAATSGTTNLTGVAFGSGRFVAVGQNGTVITSPDGATWSAVAPQDLSPNARLRGVTHTGTLFVAAGTDDSGPLLMTSLDGSSWTRQTPSLGWGYSGVGAGNGLALATSWGFVATSTNGVDWTAHPLPGDESVDDTHTGVEHVASGPAGFVACGETGALYTWPGDSSPWERQTLDASRMLGAVVEGGDFLCATGRSIARSTDNGETWMDSSVPVNWQGVSSKAAYSVAYGKDADGNGRFVIATENNLYYSTDCGPTWSEGEGTWGDLSSDDGFIGFGGVAFGEGRFVAVGSSYVWNTGVASGLLYTSTDGIEWTRPDVDVADYKYLSVAYGSDRFAAIGWSAWLAAGMHVYLTSEDGLTWTPQPWPFGTDRPYIIRAVGDRFFATGGWSSLDGQVWTREGTDLLPIAYGAGRWLAVRSLAGYFDGNIQVSTDRVHWTTNATGTAHGLGGAVYLESPNRFVVVGDSAIVYSSEPPAAEVRWLIEEVTGLVSAGALNGGQGRSLSDKLVKALDALPGDISSLQKSPDALPGDAKRAVALLTAFIHQVRAFRHAGILTPKVADELIAMAEAVIASITS